MPIEIGSRKAKFEAAPELGQHGQWVCLNIEGSCPWPVRPQSLTFGGHQIWIIPLTLEDYPGVAIRLQAGMSRDDAASMLYRLLSVISWREEQGINVAHQTGGSLPHMMGNNKKFGFSIRDLFDFTDIICPQEERPRIALGLMREARGLNHGAYSFLSFWRVLELAYQAPNKRTAWMSAVMPSLSGQGVEEALASIRELGIQDIGKYLYESGRCAIAHAKGDPIVNPDDPRDALRLNRELPLVREMAIKAIEECFGILTPLAEYRQHLYELRGWKGVFGPDLVARLLAAEEVTYEQEIDFPDIHVRLRESSPFGPLESMTIEQAIGDRDQVRLTYRSFDQLCKFRFILSFREERLLFDWQRDIGLSDDGSVRAAEWRRELNRFFRDYLLNGELQIWSAKSGNILSRKDAFLPENYTVDLSRCNALISEAQAEIDRRIARTGQSS